MTGSATAAAVRPFSAREKVALAREILASYAMARRELRRSPFPDAVASVRSPGADPMRDDRADAAEHAYGVKLGRAVCRLLSVLPTDSRCLIRALVLTSLLARRGIPSSIAIGVRSGGGFAAHAWVEHDGMPILPTGSGEYELLTQL